MKENKKDHQLIFLTFNSLLSDGGLGSFLCLTLESLQSTGGNLNRLRLAINDHVNLLQIYIPLTTCSTK